MDLLVVDGYNIIHADPDLAQLLERDLQAARDGLLAALRPLRDQGRYQIVVVFDSANPDMPQATLDDIGGIEVAFTAAGQSGDAFIENLVRRLGRKSSVIVATDDRQLQFVVQGYGAIIKTSDALRAEMTDVTVEIRRQLNELGQSRGMHRLDAQLDRELRGLLDDMRFRNRE